MLRREQLKRLNKENIAWERTVQERLHRERLKGLNKENIAWKRTGQQRLHRERMNELLSIKIITILYFGKLKFFGHI
jgi:hypothetical protein